MTGIACFTTDRPAGQQSLIVEFCSSEGRPLPLSIPYCSSAHLALERGLFRRPDLHLRIKPGRGREKPQAGGIAARLPTGPSSLSDPLARPFRYLSIHLSRLAKFFPSGEASEPHNANCRPSVRPNDLTLNIAESTGQAWKKALTAAAATPLAAGPPTSFQLGQTSCMCRQNYALGA